MSITIIAQKGSNVNISLQNCSESAQNSVQKRKTHLQTWTEHKEASKRMAQKMRRIGWKSPPGEERENMMKRAFRMAHCGDVLDYVRCDDCGKWSIRKATLCRDRLCPTCAWRLSLQRYAEMRRLMDALIRAYPEHNNWSLITLTCKNCEPNNLAATMETMSKAWNLATAQRDVRPDLWGWCKSAEVTYNRKANTMHPHYHVMIGWESESKSDKLIARWMDACTKKGLVVDIKGQEGHTITDEYKNRSDALGVMDSDNLSPGLLHGILEVFKYAVKASDLDAMPADILRAFADQISGKRLISYGGKIKEYAKLCGINMEAVEDAEITSCHYCGGVNMEHMLYKWCGGYYAAWNADDSPATLPSMSNTGVTPV